VLLALGAAWLGARLVRKQRSTRHRRMARRELGALRDTWQRASADERARTLERLPLLLKGCALGSFERSRVAKLAGAAWLTFLRSTAPGAGFEGPAAMPWSRCASGAPQPSPRAACPRCSAPPIAGWRGTMF
jgi:hypothetical protein